MTRGAAWLFVWLLVPILGAPLLAHPSYRHFPRTARAVLSGGVGAVLLSLAMTLFALGNVPWSPLPLVLATAAGAWGLRFACGPPEAAASDPPPGREPLAWALSAAAVVAALVATTSGAAGSSDLLFFWGPKAQAFAAARTIDAGFLASPRAARMHPYYPPLLTSLDALSAVVAGCYSWLGSALRFPILIAALAAALPALLRRAARPFAPAAVSALAVSALALLGAEADIAGNGDMPLLFFEILGLALLLTPEPVGRPTLLLAGVMLAGAATVKVEGLPFALAAALFFLAGSRRRGESLARRVTLLLGPAVLSLGAWLLFGTVRGAFRTYGEYGSLLDVRWERLPAVLSAIGSALWSDAYALPFLVPLAVLAVPGGVRRLPLAVAAALAAFLIVTYLLPVADPADWIRWSAARTLAPIAALLALAAAGPRPSPAAA